MALVAIDGEDDAQRADTGSAPITRSGERFGVWAERIVGDLVEASDHAPLHVPRKTLEVVIG